MNPSDDTHEFAPIWATVRPRLDGALAAKGVPASCRPDVIQETAVRLLSRWDAVDTSDDIFPLAFTIARNLSIDLRRTESAMVPLKDAHLGVRDDVEETAIARFELSRVARGLSFLAPRYRSLILAEVGVGNVESASYGATKVARSRARARLRLALEKVRGVVAPVGFRLRHALRRATLEGDAIHGVGMVGSALVLSLIAGPSMHTGAAPHAPHDGSIVRSAPIAMIDPHPASGDRGIPARGLGQTSSTSSNGPVAGTPHGASEGSPLARLPRAESEGEDNGRFGAEGYRFTQHGDFEAGGERVTWRYDHRFKSPRCVEETAEERPSTDCSGSTPSGYVEIERNGRKHRIEY